VAQDTSVSPRTALEPDLRHISGCTTYSLICFAKHISENSSQHRNPRLMKLRMMPITIMAVVSVA